MPRVVPCWRKHEVPPDVEGGDPKVIVEKHMLLSINAREAVRNGTGEWSMKEPSMKNADEVVTVPSKQLPMNSDQRAKKTPARSRKAETEAAWEDGKAD